MNARVACQFSQAGVRTVEHAAGANHGLEGALGIAWCEAYPSLSLSLARSRVSARAAPDAPLPSLSLSAGARLLSPMTA